MTVAMIGTIPSGQAPKELRVFGDDGHVATFLNTAIIDFEINDKSGQICYCQIVLSVDKNPKCIKQQARIEFLSSDDDMPLMVVFVGRVDGIKTLRKKGGPTTIAFRARALAAPLVDFGFHGEVGPTVDAVVAALVEQANLKTRTDYPGRPLLAWINTESTFAAIRLLGINLGAIVKTPGEYLELASYAAVHRRLFAPPKFAVSGDDFETSCVVEGLPFEGSELP